MWWIKVPARSTLVLMSIFLLSSCSPPTIIIEDSDADFDSVSVYSVVSNPGRFEGRNVSVSGILVSEGASAIVYPSRQDYMFYITSNAIKVYLRENRPDLDEFDGCFVTISGQISGDEDLLDPVFGGTMTDVQSVSVLTSRSPWMYWSCPLF